MVDCDYCGEEVDIPFNCKFCDGTFCSDHRLPENHECKGLEDYKKRSKRDFSVVYEPLQSQEKENKASKKRPNLVSLIFNLFSRNYYLLIIAICFLVFMLQASIQDFSEFLYIVPKFSSLMERPWTIFTSIFLHGSGFHLFVNMLVLFFFGGELERRVGSRKFLEIFLISGLLANIGYSLFSNLSGNFVPALGASGAIFGVFAALAIIAPEIKVLIWFVLPLKIRHALIIFALYDIFLLPMEALGGTFIANSAHLSGVAIGLIYGYKLKNKQKPRPLEFTWS
ncbi:MAG: rhomboid family intramembrane serine protease [Candidatus Aenigmatarchaeota archaeon]